MHINNNIKLYNLAYFNCVYESIDVIEKDNECHILVRLRGDKLCPICGSEHYKIHQTIIRKIRHSISLSSPTFIIFYQRKFKCKACGSLYLEDNPFTLKYERISLFTKLKTLELLKSENYTFTSLGSLLNLPPKSIENILANNYIVKKVNLSEVICADEFYFKNNRFSKFPFIMVDFYTNKVIDVYQSRHKSVIRIHFSRIPKKERDNVKYFIIDMYETYRDLALQYFTNAIVAVDSFHVIKRLNEVLKETRINVMKEWDLKSNLPETNSKEYFFLKKYSYFLTGKYNKIPYNKLFYVKYQDTALYKDQILNILLNIDSRLNEAYKLYTMYREFNQLSTSRREAEIGIDSIISEFISSTLKNFREFGYMIERWKEEILNSFIRINNRRLSNGLIEGTNEKIKKIIRNGNGYRNFEILKKRIF